ncbi:MAG: AraC family transcriptional regulator [Flavobacteriaceae bacterium]|nr:AraC family transcriptional regulator [Flavobacteriaceae bacterium]
MTQDENTRNKYTLQIGKVLNYIEKNLEKPFQLSELSLIGNFSPFHFHRIISAYLGEPLGVYIKRIRLERAAQLLLFSNSSVTDISFGIGYETLSSFSAAFSKQFGVSPTTYREKDQAFYHPKKMEVPSKINFDFQPEIKSFPKTKIAFIRVFGNYETEKIGKAWNTLFQFASKNKLFTEETQLYGISYDNPEISKNNHCQYNACISLKKDIRPQGEISTKELQSGKYAVFTYKGDHTNFPIIYELIFKKWLLKSAYELRSTEVFDRYLNTPFKTENNNLMTEIHLPIK